MESKIKYLWNAASSLPSSINLHHIIKSNLLYNALTNSGYNNYKFNTNLTSPNVRCQYCHTEWKHNKYSIKLLKTKKLNKREKRKCKLIAENIVQKNDSEIKKAKERVYGKVAMIKCEICSKTTKYVTLRNDTNKTVHNKLLNSTKQTKNLPKSTTIPINNKTSVPQVLQRANSIQSKSIKRKLQDLCYLNTSQNGNTESNNSKASQNNTPVMTAKKKKQRDKFAGLFRDACVSSSTPKHKNTLNALLKMKETK